MAEVVPLHPAGDAPKAIDDAVPVSPAPADIAGEDAGGKHGGGGGHGSSGDGGHGLPADFPVKPLGMSADGRLFFYLDAGNRLVIRQEKEHSRLGILALCNERWTELQQAWPRLTKVRDAKTGEMEYIVTGWKPERAAEELIAACGRRGTLNIADRVRGPGAWRGRDGELILHCGDKVQFGDRWLRPGEIDGRIYPADAPTPLPADIRAPGGQRGPAQDVVGLLQHWQWREPELGPLLMLGAIGAMKIGGALPWRPTIWLTGDYGSGKSTLLTHYVAGLCGEGGAHITVDTTAAAIWQRVRHSSHPVIIDEAENESDPRKISGMVKLARAASSGGVVYRGGSDHNAVQFTIQACFAFGSIVMPGLTPQDRSRITTLELEPLKPGSTPPAWSAAKLKACGEALTRRMADGWTRLDEVFQAWREGLQDVGHNQRSADQLGILLACGDLLLHDSHPHPDSIAELCATLSAPAEVARDHKNCVGHILTAPIDAFRGGARRTVAQWIEEGLLPEQHGQPSPLADANKMLGTYGLMIELGTVFQHADGSKRQERWLHVANAHRGLNQLFEGSHWAGQSGTTNPWVQALRRVPGWREGWKRFGGYGARSTMLPIDYLLGDEGEPR